MSFWKIARKVIRKENRGKVCKTKYFRAWIPFNDQSLQIVYQRNSKTLSRNIWAVGTWTGLMHYLDNPTSMSWTHDIMFWSWPVATAAIFGTTQSWSSRQLPFCPFLRLRKITLQVNHISKYLCATAWELNHLCDKKWLLHLDCQVSS